MPCVCVCVCVHSLLLQFVGIFLAVCYDLHNPWHVQESVCERKSPSSLCWGCYMFVCLVCKSVQPSVKSLCVCVCVRENVHVCM